MSNVLVLWAHKLNSPWLGTYLDCRAPGLPRWADVRWEFNSWWGLKPKIQEVERLNPLIAMQWECVTVYIYICGLLHYKYHNKIIFLSHHPLPKHKSSRWRKAWDVGCVCPRHAAIPGTTGAGNISSSVLVFPWRPGLQTGQCSGFIARLLQKYYSSEFSGWMWTFHLIRLYCKAWQIGGREGGSVFHFLIKIKMQKQPSDEAIWILLLLQTK